MTSYPNERKNEHTVTPETDADTETRAFVVTLLSVLRSPLAVNWAM